MPAFRGFVRAKELVLTAFATRRNLSCIGFRHLQVKTSSVLRSFPVLSLQESSTRILCRQYTMPKKAGRAKATKQPVAQEAEEEPQKETKKETTKAKATKQPVAQEAEEEPQKETKKETTKRGRAKKEENGDDKDMTAGDAAPPPPKLAKKVSDGLDSMDFSSTAKTEDGRAWNLKIASWNINGVRAWLNKDGLNYLNQEKPDVLCIQETKCSKDKLPPELKVDGYKNLWSSAEKEGYAGTGMYCKTEPISVTYGIGNKKHDTEGRVITAEFEKFYLVTSYVPNSGQGLVRLKYRTQEWDEDFSAYLKGLDAKKPVILCGDLNVAHLEIDLKNPKANKRNAGFTNEEREGFGKLLEQGFIDSFRTLYPDKEEAYTFWSNFRQAREKNIGWRLDYFVMSERLKKDMCDSVIRTHVMGSDHCPIVLLLAL